jgi:hypothetical protein
MRTSQIQTLFLFFIFIIGAVSLTACSNVTREAKYPSSSNREGSGDPYKKPDSILGKDGLNLFNSKRSDDDSSTTGIGVNSFLWRASLDTVAFMPLASADPFGGTILTDWYSPPGQSNERFKLNVFILDRQLRSDGVQVKAFKQTLGKGGWRDAAVPSNMARDLEDTILTRARQLRVSQAERTK